MAKHENLKALFTAIATSIRNKTGGTGAIIADDFPEAIDGIQAGVDKIQRYIELNKDYGIISAKYLFAYFAGASVDELLDGVDTSMVNNMEYMFGSCKAMASVPLFNTSNVTNMKSMFTICENLSSVPLFNTSKVVSMESMFYGCYKLTDVPLFDTSNVTNMVSMFGSCKQLTSVPLFNTSKVASMASMFASCSALTSVPLFNTSKCQSLYRMFDGCSVLTTIPPFDARSVGDLGNMVSNCKAMTECQIRNIRAKLQVGKGDGTGYSDYGHLLTLESLLHICKECRKTSASLTLTVGTANLAKLEGIYIKLIDITDDMRAEDDLIDEKYPFVQCESTDDGAMTIQDYMALKMWSLA